MFILLAQAPDLVNWLIQQAPVVVVMGAAIYWLSKKLNKKVDNILIFLGGGDYSPAYIKIAHAIKKFRFKKITFILAKSNYKTLNDPIPS